MKVGAIIQARMSSTRLPGKVLKLIGNKPLLEHLIEFLRDVESIDEIIIATSEKSENLEIVKLAKKLNISYYVGDEENVLNRFVQAAKKFNIDIIVRICADSFVIDSKNLDLLIQQHIKKNVDFSQNYLHEGGLPPGTGAEVFSSKILKEINSFVKKQIYKEHIDEYILQHPDKFNILKVNSTIKDQRFQFNIDKQKDLRFARKIYKNFSFDYSRLTLKNIINFVEKDQELYKHFKQIKVILRVDGSNELGLGHINRCISIAQMLEDKFKCEILFLINNNKEVQNFILRQGYATKVLDYQKEKEIINILINDYNPNLIIVDLPIKPENKYSNYENLEGYLKYLKSFNIKIIKIDYSYQILKKSFLNKKIKDVNPQVNSILVTFGGGDTDNITLKILEAIGSIKDIKIITVLGPFFEFSKEIQTFAQNHPQIIIKQNVSNMAELINQSDLAICAGGNTLSELAFFGVPSICICDDENQLKNVSYFDKHKTTINLGLKNQVNYKNLRKITRNLINDYQLRKEMSLQGRKLINNENNRKILELIENKLFENEN